MKEHKTPPDLHFKHNQTKRQNKAGFQICKMTLLKDFKYRQRGDASLKK